jgi:RNA polymerase sigma-70 factor (ECF subfamily)
VETNLEERSDQELLELARTNSQAFVVLYSRYYRHLRAYATALLKDADLADDVAEETFARLTSRLGWLAVTHRPLAPWLFCVAHNLSMDELRRQSRSQTLVDDSAVVNCDAGNDTTEEIEAHVQEIRNAISALPPLECACVMLRHTEHKTTAEIARQLGCTPRQVTLALNYAYKVLRRTLSDISPDFRSMIER